MCFSMSNAFSKDSRIFLRYILHFINFALLKILTLEEIDFHVSKENTIIIKTSNFWPEAGCAFLKFQNSFKMSVSNVLKIFSSVIVSIGFTFCYISFESFHNFLGKSHSSLHLWNRIESLPVFQIHAFQFL